MSQVRHFLSLLDISSAEFRQLIQRGVELKRMQHKGEIYQPLKNRVLAMIFEKSSTRTRVSFETGMVQFGGHALFLSPRDTQLGRGEPIEDSARVLSRMVDGIMIRTFDQKVVEKLAAFSSVPVINGLTDLYHPCQLLADMQTWYEHRGDMKGKKASWIGDGNNMCHSYINAARLLDFELAIAVPKGFEPNQKILQSALDAGAKITLCHNAEQAAEGSDLIVTDVWASMGQEEEQKQREQAFAGFQVNRQIMAKANSDALFMHCLPAHREEEVSAEVIDGDASVVWDEAENRLHAQKALIEMLMAEKNSIRSSKK